MRRITLGATGIATSSLGFGCVNLTTYDDARSALRMLAEAHDLGVTHFDVARAYGFGRAEGILGEFLRGRRDRVTVATKFGIQPPSGVAGRPGVIRVVKRAIRLLPGLDAAVRRRAAAMYRPGAFTPAAAAESLDASLRELRCGHVDLFLLHEATLADAAREDLLAFLDAQVTAGKIRAFGVSSEAAKLGGDVTGFPSRHVVFQFDDSALQGNIDRIRGLRSKATITFGVLGVLRGLNAAMARHPGLVREWTPRVGAELTDSNVVVGLLQEYATTSNRDGIVLFTTMRSDHLRDNLARAVGPGHSPEQIEAFRRFCRAVLERDQSDRGSERAP